MENESSGALENKVLTPELAGVITSGSVGADVESKWLQYDHLTSKDSETLG